MTETEEVPWVICTPATWPSPWAATNEFGECIDCGERLQHRPHIPKPSRLICLPCATIRFEDDPPESVMVTKRSVEEVLDVFKKEIQ